MKTRAAVSLIAGLLAACSSLTGPQDTAPYIGMEKKFIPDGLPIRDQNTTNLEDFAMTLPVFETGDPVSWIESGPGATNRGDEWVIHPDGAQAPVKIERLEPSDQGAQRIKLQTGPSFMSRESPPPIWVYELERTTGGWKVLESYKRRSNKRMESNG
jgi:hypothetical protein